MASEVRTNFIVSGVDNYTSAIDRANKSLDSLSGTASRSNLGDEFKKITSDIRTSLTNAEKDVASFKTTVESQKLQPTISRYWKNEEAEVRKSTDNIKADVASVNNSSAPGNNPGKLSLDRLTGKTATTAAARNPLVDSTKLYGDSRFNDTVSGIRNIGNEAEKAGEKIAKLRGKTTEFQRTLLELTDDFAPRGFNRPFNAVGRELFGQYNATSGAASGIDGAARLAALTRVKEAGIAVTRAEALATTAAAAAELGGAAAKSTATAASVSLTAAKSAETAATKALTIAETGSGAAILGIGVGTIAAFAAVAIAGVAVVKVSQNIREEAEKRLKLEIDIASAVNKQILGQKEVLANFQKQRTEAQGNRDFSKSLETNSVEQLEAKKAINVKLLEISSADGDGKATETAERLNKEILDIDARLYAIREKRAKDADEASNRRNENFKKEQEESAKREERNAEKAKAANEKRVADLKKANELIKEIGEKGSSAFVNLSSQINKDNPFVSAFVEAERASKSLYENVKNLTPELQKQAFAMQSVVDATRLFETRLTNKLGIQDLRDEADNFRNGNRYKPDNYQSVIDRSLSGKTNPFGFGKTYGQFVTEGNGKKELTKAQQNDIYNVETFNALTRNGVDPSFGIQYLGKVRGAALGTEDLSFQQRLDRKIDIITSSNPKSEAERTTAERALISLTQGLDPSKLSDRERDVAATARENEARRREQAEQTAANVRREQADYLKEIRDYQKTLTDKANKGGLNEVEVTFKNQSDIELEAKKSAKTATPQDTTDYYNQGLYGNTTGGKKGLSSF